MSNVDYDVIIVGAGLAGAALAAALAPLPLTVAVIEARGIAKDWPELQDDIDGFDPRVSAITEASRRFLDEVGAWQSIPEARLGAYRHMHVWDGEGTGFVDFDAMDVSELSLGNIVENRLLNAGLIKAISKARRIDLLDNSPVSALKRSGVGPTLVMENGDALSAQLIVAADGAMSRIRDWAGFRTREWDYGHHAVVCTVRHEQPHQATAWQRFLPSGPLAFLPLSCEADAYHYSSIVWSTQPDHAAELMAMDDGDFNAALSAAFECKLGAVTEASRRFSFPLRQRHAREYVQDGLALIGDAAHSIHPLAGQGINLGFADAQALAAELQRALDKSLPLGDLAVLERYQRRRKGDNLAMMAAMEGFKHLFEAPALPLRWLRNTGMSVFNKAEPLKRQIIKQAMGL